jgi:hypothetical protein
MPLIPKNASLSRDVLQKEVRHAGPNRGLMRYARLTSGALVLTVLALTQAEPVQAQVPPAPEAAAAPDMTVVRALAGCYALEIGAWSRAPTAGPASATTLVRLDTLPDRAGEPRGVFTAARLAPAEPEPAAGRAAAGRLFPAHWRLLPPDSVEMTPWGNGFEAEVFFGRVVGAELVGVVRRTSDALPVDPTTKRIVWDAYPTAPAKGRRVPCPSA